MLNQRFGKINYIAAKGSNQVPKTGFLDNEKRASYNLHGIGITVDFEDVSVVFDFDYTINNHTGFNSWQLARFTRINPDQYTELSRLEYDELEKRFDGVLAEMVRGGLLKFNPTTNRYYPQK